MMIFLSKSEMLVIVALIPSDWNPEEVASPEEAEFCIDVAGELDCAKDERGPIVNVATMAIAAAIRVMILVSRLVVELFISTCGHKFPANSDQSLGRSRLEEAL
jgi:hypothetical protein